MEQFFTFKKYQYFIAGILVFLGLYLASLYNYLLFHSLAEIFSIVVACGIFMVAWNSRRFLDNNYLLCIGIAYLFVGGLDLIHTLTYKGMGIFQEYGTNLATQLWLVARYTESVSLLIAPLFFRRKLKINLLFLSYTVALSLFLISIFYLKIFPLCFVEGVGLTPFKKISEYVISLILLASIVLVLKNQDKFDRDVLKWLVWSILLTIVSELAFTFYIDAYGFSNLLGHFFKIVSFYLIYKALIQMGLTRPYDLLFRNLKQSEVLLQEEKNKIQNYLDIANAILLVIDANQKVSLINKKGGEILGYNENEMIGKNWFDTFVPEKNRDEAKAEFRKLVGGEMDAIEYFENPILTRNGGKKIIGWHYVVLRDEEGNITSTLSSGEDITERKRAEEALRESELKYRIVADNTYDWEHWGDPAGKYLYVSPSCKRITGYGPEEFMAKSDLMESLVVPEDRYLFEVHTRNEVKKRLVDEVEFRIKRSDGELCWIHHICQPVFDHKGNYLGFRGSNRDITKRKRMEEELRKSRDELELRIQERTAELLKAYRKLEEQSRILEGFFTSTITPLVFLDRNFDFIRVNKAYAKACQRDISEFLGHNHFEFYPHEENEAIFKQVVETKAPYQAFAKPFSFPDHPEWGVTYWDWTLTPILDDEGETEFLVFSLEDMTERKRTEDSLRAAHQYNRSLIEASVDPLVTINPEGKVTDVNSATELATGVSRDQLIGSDFSDYFTEPEKAREGYQTTFLKGTVRDYPLAIRHTSGKITHVLYNATLYRNEAGEIQGVFAAARDITERKRAEEALRVAHQYNRSLIEASLDPIVTISADGKIMDANKAAELVRGVLRHQLIGSDFSNYFTEPKKAREGYQEVFEKGSVRDYPLAIRHISGHITPVLYNATVYKNEAGEIQGVFAAARDITERKKAEEAAQAQYALREAIENSLVTGIMVVKKDGRLAHVNPALCRMTGWAEEELIGSMPPFSFWPIEPLETRAKSFRALLREKIPLESFETRLCRKNGESFDALVLVSSLKNAQGKALGWVASIGDITQRKETERRIHATNTLLSLFSKKPSRKEYLDSVVDLIQNWSGCRCVGIRVLNKQGDIPYESYVGFSREFWESENWLSVQRDQCVCIRVVTGKSDPQDISVITPGGSFCCGNTIEFVNHLSDEEKSRYRGLCIKNGFLSVTIIPIRYLDKIVGAIHLADKREAFMPLSIVEFLESMAPLIGEAINRLNLEEELRESENRLRVLSLQLLTVQENERKRIAMELHDGIGQMLTAIKFKVENILQEKGKGKARAKEKSLKAIVPMVRESVEEVRRIQMDLRPSTLDDLGILATLGWFCREYQKIYSHIRIEKEIGLQESEVSTPLKTVIYRLTQEALNNIAKHSKADLIHLSLRKREDRVEWVVKDNGIGFDLEEILSSERSERGLGLNSMRERTELSGGSFEIETTLGAGTMIRVSWPL
jgi:PAS domain S-box-containing protein